MSADQREHARVTAAFRVRASALDPDALAGENVSRGGIFVKTVRFLPLNTVIRLTIEVPGTTIAVPATCRVAFVRDEESSRATGKSAGMGLELLDIAPDQRPILERLLAERQAGGGAQAASRAPDLSEGRLRVVVVDDDPRYREMAAAPFQKRGDTVLTTADGLEALSACLKEPPDVILSDVQMPRMDGWQLLRLVRARPSLASVPVVFLTTLSGEAERLLGYQLGVDAYIQKPYEPEGLLVRVHQIVRRARNARSSPSARSTWRGDLAHVGLQSLFTFLEVERKSGVLLVLGNEVARLFFSEGRLLRAEIEGEPALAARQAAMRILDSTSGQFEFAPGETAVQDEISVSVTALLLEHARLTDERKR
jgi:DNA-binding response OmpR family regulator/Tfp pilus assembly protein PilZ